MVCSVPNRVRMSAYVLSRMCLCAVIIAIVILPNFLHAQTTDRAIQKDWTIAAMPFTFSQSKEFSTAETSIGNELPSMILSHLSSNLTRTIDLQEQADRTLHDLRQKRHALFLQLSSETQTRDVLVLGGYSKRALAHQMKLAEKKINEIDKQIDENLVEVQKTLDKLNGVPDKKKRSRFARKTTEEIIQEQVRLYQNDSTQLFPMIDDEKSISDYHFSERVMAANINAILTGKIMIYGNYISCSVELFSYPGAKAVGSASEVGRADNLIAMSQSIAQQLVPHITTQLPVTLFFSVSPPEAVENISVTIDDMVFREVPSSVVVQAGVHSILFSAQGFQQAGVSYAFAGDSTFNINAILSPIEEGSVFLRLKKQMEGTFYSNALYVQKAEDSTVAQISVNGRAVLGQFVTEDGSAALYYIPEKLLTNENMLTLNAKPFDRSTLIEKRRKEMYIAYSVFMVSLIPTFYIYGSFTSELNAYNQGHGDLQTAQNWQYATWATTGVSISAAAIWVIFLVRYLMAANKVLPEEAKQIRK